MTSSNSADTAACLRRALALLARRDHFSTELVEKLIEKEFSRDDAEAALKKLRELRYLDDRRILEAYAAEMKRRRKGFLFFCKKLMEKKARSLFTDRELREAYPEEDERAAAQALVKRMRWEGAEARRRLASRGFSMAAIRTVNG